MNKSLTHSGKKQKSEDTALRNIPQKHNGSNDAKVQEVIIVGIGASAAHNANEGNSGN